MIRFSVLGPLAMHVNGVDVAFPGAMPGKVLALLLSRSGRPVSADAIADQLWQGSPPRTARKYIQVVIHRLRQLPGMRDRITLSPQGYALEVAGDECDALLFDAGVSRAVTLLRDGDIEAADETFARALGRWRGPAFCGVEGMPMVTTEVERLTERRLAALEDHVDVRLDRGRHHAVLAELTSAAATHPFRERLRGQLMLALYRSGQGARALEEYRSARRCLHAELGVEPGAALRELHRRILSQDTTLEPPTPPRRHVAPVCDFLPRCASGFVARRDELCWLDGVAAERSMTTAVAAVAGLAGIGKTALALTWAHRRASLFPDGLLHVRLRSAGTRPLTTHEALHHLLSCLGVPASEVPASLAEAAARYRALLSGRRVLILVDDARSADQVRPLLPAAPDCFVVVTSRASLGGLVACDGARQLVLRPLPESDAVTLLRRLLGDQRIDAEPAAVRRLVDVCSGLPLALRIAAAQLDQSSASVGDYVARLTSGGVASTLAVDGDEHNGVRAAFDASYEALTAPSKHVFRALGTIPGVDFTRDTVMAAADMAVDDADAGLAALASMHLVEPVRQGRFTVHNLLRDYSLELLRQSDTPSVLPAVACWPRSTDSGGPPAGHPS